MQAGRWAPLCLTGSFRPSRPALCWRLWSAAADIDHLSARNCTLLTIFPPATRPGLPAAGVPLSSDCSADSVPREPAELFSRRPTDSGRAAGLFSFSLFFPHGEKTFSEITRGRRRNLLSHSRLILLLFGKEKPSHASSDLCLSFLCFVFIQVST